MPTSWRRLDAIAVISMATFLVWADRQVVVPILPALARDFHTSIGAAAEVVSVYSLTYGLFEIAYGGLSDRFGRVRVMSLALQVFGFGTLATGLMPSLGAIVVLRGIAGAAAAAIVPIGLAYIGDTVALNARQAAIGRVNTANALGQALSVALGGVMVQLISWRVLFIVYGLAANAVALRLRRAPETAGAPAGKPLLPTLVSLVRRPGVLLLYTLGFVEGGVLLGTYVYLSPALKSQGYSYLVIGFVLAAFGVSCLPATRLIRPVLQRCGSALPLIWAGGLSIVAGYGLVALRDGLWEVLACAALLGLAYGWLHTTLQTWATAAYSEARGMGVSGFAFALFVGAGVFVQVLAPFADSGAYRSMFMGTAVLGLLLTAAAVYGFARFVVGGTAVHKTAAGDAPANG